MINFLFWLSIVFSILFCYACYRTWDCFAKNKISFANWIAIGSSFETMRKYKITLWADIKTISVLFVFGIVNYLWACDYLMKDCYSTHRPMLVMKFPKITDDMSKEDKEKTIQENDEKCKQTHQEKLKLYKMCLQEKIQQAPFFVKILGLVDMNKLNEQAESGTQHISN